MNNQEALIVLRIMATADHGCSSCVRNLFVKFLVKYPDTFSLVDTVWNETFEDEQVDWQKEVNLEEDY